MPCLSASLVTALALPRSGVPIARTVRDGVVFAGRAVLTEGELDSSARIQAVKTAGGRPRDAQTSK